MEIPNGAPAGEGDGPPVKGGPSSAQASRAAWWVWPLLLFALLPLDRVVGPYLPAQEGNALAATSSGAAEFALLEVQAKVLIASSRADPEAAGQAIDRLAKTVTGDRAVASLALLDSFVDPASGRAETRLTRFSQNSPAELVDLTRRALTTGIEAGERERLRERIGWFASLARGAGSSPPPEVDAIYAQSLLVVAVAGLVILAMGAGFLGGAILLIRQLRRWKSGVSRPAFVAMPRHRGVLMECFALYLGLMTLSALVGAFLGPIHGIAGYAAAAFLPLVWPRIRGVGWREFRQATGLHRGLGWARECIAGVGGYLMVMAIASIGVAMSLGLVLLAEQFQEHLLAAENGSAGREIATAPNPHPIVGWIHDGEPWQRILCLLFAAGFAPLFEEIFFRGAFQGSLRTRFRFLSSALISALVFAALHPQGVFAIPSLAAMGFGFSLLRELRDSLVAPMIAHAINNGILVLILWALL